MAMAEEEPPLKKQKQEEARYDLSEDMDMEMSPEPERQQASVALRVESVNAAVQSTLQAVEDGDECATKRRHRIEIGNMYRAYRMLKSCLVKHPNAGMESDRDLEKAYYTMLKLANGCPSVRRIAAEMIPRYAVYCPSALEGATRVTLQISEWASISLKKEQTHSDARLFTETAEACFSGLIQICEAAHNIPSVYTNVIRSVSFYLFRHFYGNELVYEDGVSGFDQSVSKCISKLFCFDPENVLGLCFELLQDADAERRKQGLHSVTQLLKARNASASEEHDLISKVIHPKPGLERWIISRVRAFRKMEKAEIVKESLENLHLLVKSLKTFTPSDLELEDERGRSRIIVNRSDDSRTVRTVRGFSPESDLYGSRSRLIRSVTIERTPEHPRKVEEPLNGRAKKDSALSSPSRDSGGEFLAFDVYMPSVQILVTLYGATVSESMLRTQFDIFGEIEEVSMSREQRLGCVRYTNIRDAVEARGEMQGSTIWGKPLQIKFSETDTSSFVLVGKVSSQVAKDELLKDLANAGFKTPVTVANLVTSGSLLLEYEQHGEANSVLQHIRQRRTSYGAERAEHRHLWIGRIDPMVSDDEVRSAFSQFGELSGWKFIRSSNCGYIDFRSSEAAATAKARLNGVRFGSQAIVVEFKNAIQKNSPTVFTSPSRSTSSMSSPPVNTKLFATLENLCSKFSLEGGKAKGKFSYSRETVPTNTLWIGLPDAVPPGFMSEIDLRTIFNVACDGTGVVTKVRSARTPRGPCRFVEFDGVEAATTALRNIYGHFDSSIQIEFSNSAISLHQTDHPYHQQQLRREKDGYRSPSAEFEECKLRQRPHNTTWVAVDGLYESSTELRSPGIAVRGDSTGSTIGSPSMMFHPPPPPPPLVGLPVGYPHLDRVPSSNSWPGSTPLDPISPAASTPRGRVFPQLSVGGIPPGPIPAHPSLQSPVTPAVRPFAMMLGMHHEQPPVLAPCSPPPPLPVETPPPPPPSPPPPLPPPPPQVLEHPCWCGLLCKSGLQYCEVMVYREESSRGQYAGALHEPAGWPDKLDVTKRADLKSLKQTFNNCPSNQREICRLYACPSPNGENYNGFMQFMQYLKQRDRAGVVKIASGQGIWSRNLYILPWAAEASAMLSVPAEPADSLLCIVLPSLHP